MVQTIHEYDYLGIERRGKQAFLTKGQAAVLQKVSERYGQRKLFDWYGSDVIRWRQFVGIVQVGDLTLEILPKTHLHEHNVAADRTYLLRMLAESGMFPLSLDELAGFETQGWTLLDVTIYAFAKETMRQLRSGRVYRYETVHENRATLRGKLLVGEHAKRGPAEQLRLPCRFSVYTPNTAINQLLRTAAQEGMRLTKQDQIRQELAWVERQFDDVDLLKRPYRTTIPRIVHDRCTSRYSKSCNLAELLLNGIAPSLHSGKVEYHAMLFDMNVLFEHWVAAKLKKVYAQVGKSVDVQHNCYSLFNGPTVGAFWLQPDIVIGKRSGHDITLVDTKWKLLKEDDPYQGVSQSDAYQMYAYLDRYNAARVILMYPHHPGLTMQPGKQATYTHPRDPDKTLEIWSVDLHEGGVIL